MAVAAMQSCTYAIASQIFLLFDFTFGSDVGETKAEKPQRIPGLS
jgi:hypothetical protein